MFVKRADPHRENRDRERYIGRVCVCEIEGKKERMQEGERKRAKKKEKKRKSAATVPFTGAGGERGVVNV